MLRDLIRLYLYMYCLVHVRLCFADYRITFLQIQLWLSHGPSVMVEKCAPQEPASFGSFPVSSVCLILKEKFRGSGCLKFSIMCLDSLRHSTHDGATLPKDHLWLFVAKG